MESCAELLRSCEINILVVFSDIPVFCLDSKLPTTLNFELVTGGYFTKFNTGRLRPEVQPLTLLYTILAEKAPLLYTFYC